MVVAPKPHEARARSCRAITAKTCISVDLQTISIVLLAFSAPSKVRRAIYTYRFASLYTCMRYRAAFLRHIVRRASACAAAES